jgi:hypothetical protein
MRALITAALACFVGVWSLATVVIDVVTSPYRLAAERLEDGASADLAYFTAMSREITSSEKLALCSRDMTRSAASIMLAGIDAALKTLDPVVSGKALAEAQSVLKAGLRCFPQDGNLWLRLAMVELARAGPRADVERMIRLSAAMAPRERWILVQRIAFASRLADLKLASVEDTLRADVETLVRRAAVADIKDVYTRTGSSSRRIVEELLPTLESPRRAMLERALQG